MKSENNRWHSFEEWVINHDESWLFVGLYVGLAVVLSIWISLFWLVAVVAIHAGFEWIRQRHLRTGFRPRLLETLWEVKLDIALVLFALALSLYMEVILGIVGLHAASRAGAATLRGGARFAAWEQVIRGFFLTVDDAAQVARAVVARKSGDEEISVVEAEALVTPVSWWGSWAADWGKGDWIAVGMTLICVVMMLLATTFTDHTWGTVTITLLEELHPYPPLLK
ncbi:MAG: hypothetical protein R6X32_08865 [Chloroflexota bacterium]|jgi:hypothetical protein